MQLSSLLRFWLKLLVTIPAIGCAIFILYHFLVNRNFRRSLSNHVIIVIIIFILINQLTCNLWTLYFYFTHKVLFAKPIFCHIWRFVDYYAATVLIILVGWASIERHILIFHDKWLLRKRKRFLIHYLPLIICIVYPFIFYIILLNIISCNTKFDYTLILCGNNDCLYQSNIIHKWDSIANCLIPSSIIVSFSIALLIRVLYQKRRLHQRIQWRKYRRMTIQLLSISIIYCIVYIPTFLLNIAYNFGLSYDVGAEYYSSSWYFVYFTFLFIPITFALSLSEFRSIFKKIFLCFYQRPKRAVVPMVWTANRVIINRTNTKHF